MEVSKLKNNINFYFSNKTSIVVSRDDTLVYGIVSKKLPLFFPTYFELKLNDGNFMQIHIDEVNDIYPDSYDIEIINKSSNSFNRRSIPKSLRKHLWRNHFGERTKGECSCCKKPVARDSFECGHYISVANGGSDSLNNLRVICFDCNRSMSSQNMKDFVESYYS